MSRLRYIIYKAKIVLRWTQLFLLAWESICEESGFCNPYKSAWEKAFASPGYFASWRSGGRFRKIKFTQKQLDDKIRQLRRAGYIERVREANKNLYRLTSKGEFEVLKSKLLITKIEKEAPQWSGWWCLILFDVPEYQRQYRNLLRKWLKQLGFLEWQKSVWISPYDWQDEFLKFISYLKLSPFVEFLKVRSLPNEAKFKKRFKIK